MQVAVLADIHSNHIALKACLEHAVSRGVDTYLFLGDYVGELAYPRKTMELLYAFARQHDCRFIRGNREDYWTEYESRGKTGWKEFDTTTGCLYYAYHQLTEEDLSFFRSLPHTAEIRFPQLPPLTICHGSPSRANEQLLPESENTLTALEACPNDYLLCGHTHKHLKVQHKEKTLLNPGSAGLNQGCGKARYMVLEGSGDRWQETFFQLDYDAEAIISELHQSGLSQRAPYWCLITEHMLRGGTLNHSHVLNRAMALCREDTGSCNFPDIAECYWAEACHELFGQKG